MQEIFLFDEVGNFRFVENKTNKRLLPKGEFILRALAVEDLKPGMTLARTIVNDDMVVVLSENTLLTKPHITRLQFLNIPAVYVKDEYELSTNYQNVQAMLNPGNSFVTVYKEVINTAEEIFTATVKDGEVPVTRTEELVDDALSPMARQSGVIDYLYELNYLAGDVYNHSLRVSVLCGVVGKWIHLPMDTCRDLMIAGFLHDIGKTKFSERLLDKNPETLNEEDRETYIQHTVDGHHILSGRSDLSDGVKLAALQHHECMDGTGFPFASSGNDIHEYARIVALADIYDNLTTERIGHVKETPFAAIAMITGLMFTKLDPSYCVPFLNHLKTAFMGSTVVLSNGLKGIVVSYAHDFASLPLVRISRTDILDLNEHPMIKIIDYNPKE